MDADKRVSQNLQNPQEPAFSKLGLVRYYNTSLTSLDLLYERAEQGNMECAKALHKISAALLNITGRLAAHEGYEETYEEEVENA